MDANAELRRLLLPALEASAAVLDAYLFGSTARGTANADSDVDVAVFLDTALSPVERGRLSLTLGATLTSALGRDDVDLVVLNDASPLLYYRVLRDGARLLSREPRATAGREGRALSRWYDWQPVQDRMDAIRRQRRRERTGAE